MTLRFLSIETSIMKEKLPFLLKANVHGWNCKELCSGAFPLLILSFHPLSWRYNVVTISFSPRCKVHTLLVEYVERNFTPHHYPLHADHLPNMSQCLQLLEDIYTCLQSGRKTAIQWVKHSYACSPAVIVFWDYEGQKNSRYVGVPGDSSIHGDFGEWKDILRMLLVCL